MKKVIRLSESDITKLVKRVLEESHEDYSDRYMFFSNLEQMRRQCDMLLELDQDMVTQILDDGHDWAQDHIAEAKNNMDQVFDFMMNHIKGDGQQDIEDASFVGMMEEGRKKTGTKLCARGYAAAKSKFKVFPSAYSNGYGVQVCKEDVLHLIVVRKRKNNYFFYIPIYLYIWINKKYVKFVVKLNRPMSFIKAKGVRHVKFVH